MHHKTQQKMLLRYDKKTIFTLSIHMGPIENLLKYAKQIAGTLCRLESPTVNVNTLCMTFSSLVYSYAHLNTYITEI